jgi:Rrf2 family transcriptional regulator, iron-sulfur cluster assembly transcription factor
VQLSTRGRYAVMALVDLASRQTLGCECGRTCLAEIAERQKLSQAYLEQLFGKLRRAGLVSSARGPGGGYRLTRPSDAIAIADIVEAVEEPLLDPPCETMDRCQANALWEELDRHIRQFLGSVTLADVVTGRIVGRAVPLAAD